MEETKEAIVPRVLSLDTSLCNTGYSVFEWVGAEWRLVTTGIFSTKKEAKKRNIYVGDDVTRRITYIVKGVRDVVEEFDVRTVVCEATPGGSQSNSAAAALAMAKTMVVCFSLLRRIPLIEVSPTDVKVGMGLTGNASKLAMKDAACAKYPQLTRMYKNSPTSNDGYVGTFEHIADSIGVFHACTDSNIIKMLESM